MQWAMNLHRELQSCATAPQMLTYKLAMLVSEHFTYCLCKTACPVKCLIVVR